VARARVARRSVSRYHAEAGIAAEHGLAPSFAQTRWDRIVECYALLAN
jgi:predicted RNA polymerase sigma factor